MSYQTPAELWGQSSTAQTPLKAPSLTGAFAAQTLSLRDLLKPNGTAPDVQLSSYKLARSMGPPKLIDISEVFGESKTEKSKASQSKTVTFLCICIIRYLISKLFRILILKKHAQPRATAAEHSVKHQSANRLKKASRKRLEI